MEIEKLIEAVRLCGSTPKVDQCKQCAYWSGGDMSKCIPRMTTDAATALAALQAENEKLQKERDAAVAALPMPNGWVSVKGRLPGWGQVLVTDGCTVTVTTAANVTADGEGITHWMPLPAPPGKEAPPHD